LADGEILQYPASNVNDLAAEKTGLIVVQSVVFGITMETMKGRKTRANVLGLRLWLLGDPCGLTILTFHSSRFTV